MKYHYLFMSTLGALVLAANGVATYAANTANATDAKSISSETKVLNKLRANFIDLPVSHFGPAPIMGLYEFVSNDTMLYYSPDKNLLFVGEIYAKDGHSVTAASLAALQKEMANNLPLDKALKIGNGPKRIIEFTDPECPYCQAYNKFVSRNEAQLTRYVFFFPLTELHPKAAAMAVHILCARDPQATFKKIYAREPVLTELNDCATGRELLAKQVAIGRHFGVNSTPSLILGDGERVNGFDRARIAKFLSQK
jgi:thiol:disulfide interchange protein DsbC